ncbi:MAG: hypothetical protein RIQ53_1789 [Pseudomonadota bacterium]|jgi:RNA recognition motif-containing protein
MDNKLYVGNLPYTVTGEELEQQFGAFGTVNSAKVMMDRDTGRSKGFGFVEMANGAEAQEAIRSLNGHAIGGRNLIVNVARPPEPRTGGFGGGAGGQRRTGGGGGGYGGGNSGGGWGRGGY